MPRHLSRMVVQRARGKALKKKTKGKGKGKKGTNGEKTVGKKGNGKGANGNSTKVLKKPAMAKAKAMAKPSDRHTRVLCQLADEEEIGLATSWLLEVSLEPWLPALLLCKVVC